MSTNEIQPINCLWQSPEAIGHAIGRVIPARTHGVHLINLGLHKTEKQTPVDVIRTIGEGLGELVRTTANQSSDIWELNSFRTSEGPGIPIHTDCAEYVVPPEIVMLFNLADEPSGEILTLNIERILGSIKPGTKDFETLNKLRNTQANFSLGDQTHTGPVLSKSKFAPRIRFNSNLINNQNIELATETDELFTSLGDIAQITRLQPGEGLAIDNHSTLHRHLGDNNPDRDLRRVRVKVANTAINEWFNPAQIDTNI